MAKPIPSYATLCSRFWSQVTKGDPTICWLWQGRTHWNNPDDLHGYGQFWLFGKPMRAHRVAWELTFGSPPKGISVIHIPQCHSHLCVNPSHLMLNTDDNRFWARLQKGLPQECWMWKGGTLPNGYGRISREGKSQPAHRVSWMIHNGPIPKGLWILHRCDNPLCMNPNHLFLGSAADNTHDMYSKDRAPIGERHGMSKLTARQVLNIRELHATGSYTQRQLAISFSISQSMVSLIVLRRNWGHI